MNNKNSKRYAVRYKDTKEIYQYFEHYGEALYCITDSFGPEGHKVEAIDLKEYKHE